MVVNTNKVMILKIFLLLFLVFLFIIFAFGFSIVKFIFRLFFGGGNSRNAKQQQSSREQRNKTNYTGTRYNKVISKEEGEYIDYEEIK